MEGDGEVFNDVVDFQADGDGEGGVERGGIEGFARGSGLLFEFLGFEIDHGEGFAVEDEDAFVLDDGFAVFVGVGGEVSGDFDAGGGVIDVVAGADVAVDVAGDMFDGVLDFGGEVFEGFLAVLEEGEKFAGFGGGCVLRGGRGGCGRRRHVRLARQVRIARVRTDLSACEAGGGGEEEDGELRAGFHGMLTC